MTMTNPKPKTRKTLRWEHYADVDPKTRKIVVSTANMLADVASLYKGSNRTRGDFLNDCVAAWEISADPRKVPQK